MNKKINLFIVMVTSIFVLAGCTTSPTDSGTGEATEGTKIGVVTDSGGIHDKSFNQGTWEGVEKFSSETKIGATYKESKNETEYVPNLQAMTDTEGVQIVIAIGENLSKAVYEVASKEVDTDYILIDGEPQNAQGEVQKLDNVKSYLFNEQEAGYLVGYIAGKVTETNKIGFIGGMEITPVQKFGWGFVQGVNASNPEASVNYQYSGSFTDAAKGGQLADQMYGQGVDIIFSCAGGTNDGVLNSAKKVTQSGTPAWVIGVDRDMYEDGKYGEESVVLTSAIKNVGEAAYKGLKEEFDDTFKGGTEILGYAEQGVGVPETNPNLEGKEDVIKDAKASLESSDVADNKEETEKNIGDFKVEGNL